MHSTSLLLARFTICAVLAILTWGCSQGSAERENAAPVVVELPPLAPDPRILPDTVAFEDTPVGRNGRLRVEGTQMVNERGEPIQLRGISSMWLNWENTGYATNYTALQWMRDNWGVTVIRAAMGVSTSEREPASGGYLTSPTAIEAKVEQIVDNATQLGVYVIIDWHDHFAQDNVEESKDFFRRMAAQYKDNPGVIYEIFNEPMPGVFGGDGERFGWADDFKPYHEAVIPEIRAEDPLGIIVLGTPFWSQNVDEAAADPVAGDNLMYTVHFYSCTHDQWLRDKAQVAIDAGLAIFVTEWGATDADGGVDDDTVCDEEADRWHDFMDANGISWAAWKLDDCDEASCLLRAGAPRAGDWETWLQGHGPYVVEKLTSGASTGASPEVTEPMPTNPASNVEASTGNPLLDAGAEPSATLDSGSDLPIRADAGASSEGDSKVSEAGPDEEKEEVEGGAEVVETAPPKPLPDAGPAMKTTDAALN